tara:strand:- start:144 stop:329 length:186 start_codon:yes stop_codon:yes gene_type:complete
VTDACREVLNELLKTSKAIKNLKFSTYQELQCLLKKESQLMIKVGRLIAFDLQQRNNRFLR